MQNNINVCGVKDGQLKRKGNKMEDLQIHNVMILISSILLFISLAIGLNLILVCAKMKEVGKKELEWMVYWLSVLLTLFYAIYCCL